MTDTKDGGPAFPGQKQVVFVPPECTHTKQIEIFQNGMTLRDWFAGMAMSGILFAGYKPNGELPPFTKPRGESTSDCVARVSYEYASAMLRAREEKK